jgi:hypothetical protein
MTSKSRLAIAAAAGLGALGLLARPGGLDTLLASNDFLPHGVCYTWRPALLALHVGADSLIALAYLSIPATIAFFVRRRRDLPFNWIFVMFAAFILACGATHVMEVATLWQPLYWLSGAIKAGTAVVSLATAASLVWLVPQALALPSAKQLRDVTVSLHQEIDERRRIEIELRRTQASLEASQAQLRQRLTATTAQLDTLFEQAPIGLGLWDRELRYLRVNQALATINGVPVPAHIGRTVAEVVPGIDHEQAARLMRETLERGALQRDVEIAGQTPAQPGAARWWNVNFFPVKEAEAIVGVGATCVEITEQKRHAAERQQLLEGEREARAQAERANRAKDDFLATVSHELRNPLSAILGWTHLLERGALAPEENRRAIETIARNARAQAKLVEDLLDFARLGSNRLEIERVPMDAGQMLRAAVETARAAARAKGVGLALDLGEGSMPLSGDPERLDQVIDNLLSNALKFTPAGGHVRVAARRAGSGIVVTVSDDGAGIAADMLPHVFEPFWRGDRKTTREHQGAGLGLAIVRNLVELHEGTVVAQSAGAGLGTTVTVTLPVSAVVLSAPPPLEPPAARNLLAGRTVMVVDDLADARDALRVALELNGAQVIACDSAAAATEALDTAHVDVLVSDIGMPFEDGYALLRRVRGDARAWVRSLPAIALTAFDGAEERALALAAGFDRHIAKPVEVQALVQALRELLAARRA